jgi:3-oxoacyl-[acyl-carrier protein] reductase
MTRGTSRRVVVVTGAAQGIGRVIATEFARGGWSVAAADLQEGKIESVVRDLDDQGDIAPFVLDVRDEDSIQATVAGIEQRFGRIDALINNAALFTALRREPLVDIALSEWKRVMDVNLTGPFLMTRAVAEPMRRAGGGSIVNIATVGIYHGSNQLAHYNASKAGLIGLTRTAARELGRYGIRVNAIAPGATATEEVRAVSSPERLAERAQNRCLQRVQTPQDLVGPLLFLASDQASFITGQLINVDGGEFFH